MKLDENFASFFLMLKRPEIRSKMWWQNLVNGSVVFGPWSQLNKLFSEYLVDLDIVLWYFSLFQKGYKLVECAKIKERSLKKIIVICNTVHKSNIMWYVTRFCALVERFFHDEHFICIINYCIEWSVLF